MRIKTEDGNFYLAIKEKDIDDFDKQFNIVRTYLKANSPETLKALTKIRNYISFPSVEKYLKHAKLVDVRIKIVMDAMAKLEEENIRNAMPEINQQGRSVKEMVHFTIRRMMKYREGKSISTKEFLKEADKAVFKYLNRLNLKTRKPYIKTDYKRFALVGRVAMACGHKLSYKRDINIDSSNEEVFDAVKYALNQKASR